VARLPGTAAPGQSASRPSYVLPIKWRAGQHRPEELTGYLRQLARSCEVLVVDGSPDPVFTRHHGAWGELVHHLRPDPSLDCRNGKVSGVITGVRAASQAAVVVADDDVRYDQEALSRVVARLDHADLVIPQNYFDPAPWHAAWDSARSLLNRALGTDYPGTMAVRRQAFLAAGCYDGDVLFENLELIRTLRAAGARISPAPDLFVRRLPPDTRQFLGQRVRQAYDSLAQPPRLAAELTLLPAALLAVHGRRTWQLAGACAGAAALAEVGRRRHGGTAAFPWPVSLLAPAWLAERAVCSWLAMACRLRGGVRYGGQRLPLAANSVRALRRRAGAAPCPGQVKLEPARPPGPAAHPALP
jgi:glycosyl transferase family 2